MAVFSFHPVKSIAMGEGGAVTTNDAELGKTLRRLRDHGIVRDSPSFEATDMALGEEGEPHPWYYEVQSPGHNYRASDIHCALGLSQLRKLDRFARRRKLLSERYDRLLAPPGTESSTCGQGRELRPRAASLCGAHRLPRPWPQPRFRDNGP